MAGRSGRERDPGRVPAEPSEQGSHVHDVAVRVAEWVGAALVSCAVGGAWVWAWLHWADRPVTVVMLALVTVLAVALLAVVATQPRPGRGALALFAALCVVVAAFVAVVTFPRERTDACGRGWVGDATEVMVVWDDEQELDDFCATVAAYDGSEVMVTSVGEDIGRALDRRFASGDVPELAIVPQPNLVRRYGSRGQLCEVPADVSDLFPDTWNDLVSTRVDGNTRLAHYGAFVKGAHKSLLWYDTGIVGEGPPPETWSWDQFHDWLVANVGREPYLAPLAVPAENRWPLTDWFENELANRYPDLYRSIASLGEEGDEGAEPEPVDWTDASVREELRAVLEPMADLWATAGLFVGDEAAEVDVPTPAEMTWQEAADAAVEGDVAIAFGPSFMAGRIVAAGATQLRPMGFPGRETVPERPPGTTPLVGDGRPIVVGGDAAVLPVLDEEEGCPSDRPGRALLRWLTGDGMAQWADNDPGFLTPNEDSPALARGADDEQPVRRYLTLSLREAPGDSLFFDLSDNQFALANDGDPRGTWDIFADFFQEVTDGGDPRAGIPCVLTRLEYEYRGEEWPAPCERTG